MSLYQVGKTIKDGEYTETIYSMIAEQNYNEVIPILNNILQNNLNSRAGLSLLGFCYFQTQDFISASNCYEKLTWLFSEETDYKLYYAQSLYQSCLYDEAMNIVNTIKNPTYEKEVVTLKAAIKYGQDDVATARRLLEQGVTVEENPDVIVNHGCLLYKDGHYEEALSYFTTAVSVLGNEPRLIYNVALCYYQLKEYTSALKHIGDIIKRGIRDHPELNVGMTTEGIEVRSVGNTGTLYESALIEAFNLKAAIEFQFKNYDSAREAMTDMPPRMEHEIDAVTLHNQALMNMNVMPTEGFEKLQFLLQQNPCPPETLGNLLILYCKYEYYDLAADILAENSHLTYKYLSPYLYSFLDGLITQETAADIAYKKFDEIASKQMDLLRKATKTVQQARETRDDQLVKKAVVDYEETLEKYIPVLMAQAKIYWDAENYIQVENIFHKSVEYCNENDIWRLHVAHVLFMQEKFKEASAFYEPLVKKSYNNILNVSAIVLANLCVSYIMIAQNEDAEDLMRKLEKEEDRLVYDDPAKKVFHLCIVNLVIGTLYCAKGNYEFGISRIIRSLEPYNKKLGTDTWFYAKRCILALIENMGRHLIFTKDSFNQDVIRFLEQCELNGRNVIVNSEPALLKDILTTRDGRNTVTYEAYEVDLYLRQKWQDERLKHDDITEPLDLNDPNLVKAIWKPEVYFPNAKHAEFQYVTVPNVLVRIQPDGEILYMLRLKLTFSCMMDLSKFPLDTQTCTMEIASFSKTTEELRLEWKTTNAVIMAHGLRMPQFEIVDITTTDCQESFQIGNYSCLVAKFTLSRSVGYHLVQSYLPTMLIVAISWVSFWMDVDSVPGRTTLGVTTLLAVSSQSSGIQSGLPQVSYVKAIDVWMGTCTAFVFSALLEFTIVNYMWRKLQPHLMKKFVSFPEQQQQSSSNGNNSGGGTMATIATTEGVKKRPSAVSERAERSSTDLAVAVTVVRYFTKRQVKRVLLQEGYNSNDFYLCDSSAASARKIDEYSRFLFPLAFTIFNFIYWWYYLISE